MKTLRGFTLIEVLLAAVILFSALSLAVMALQTLRQSSAQAEKSIKTLDPARMISLIIQQQIRANPEADLQGEGDAQQVHYRWQAKIIAKGSAPERFDFDAGTSVVPPERFRLFLVDLELTYQGRTEQLQFKELAWLPM